MRSLVKCRRGATAIEYGLFAALAVILLSSGVSTIGDKIGGTFANAAGAMAAPVPVAAPGGADASIEASGGGGAHGARHIVVDEQGNVQDVSENS